MLRPINTIKKLTRATAIKWAIACAAAAAFVPTASADVRDYRGNGRNDYHDNRDNHWDRDHHDDHNDVHVGVGFGAAPAVVYRTERVWVEPVYNTVCDRVWVDPVYRTDCVRVWVDPAYQLRDTVRWDHGRRIVVRENVLVSAGHYEDRPQQVLVTPGYYRTVERQVLVTPGCWQERQVPVTVAQPAWSFNLGFFGH